MPIDQVRIVNLDGDALAMRCKSWRCQDCRPWLKKRLRASIVTATEENRQLRRFFTLTLPGAARQMPLQERYTTLTQAFSRLCRRIERREGRRMPYLQVREAHRDGTPHIHGIMDRYRSQRQLAADWRAVGGGSVDIRLVDPHRVAAYLSKYLVKDDGMLPRGCRKYGSGGGVRLHAVRPPSGGGAWRTQVHGRDLQGRPAWLEVWGDAFGAALGRLQHRDAVPRLARAMHRHLMDVELRELADRIAAAACIICSELHDVHPVGGG